MEAKPRIAILLDDRTTPPPPIGFGSHSRNMEIRFVNIVSEDQIEYGFSYHSEEFSQLVFRCQWDTATEPNPLHLGRTYAHTLEYQDVYRIGLLQAERMTKMLRRIERNQKKFPNWPEGFGQFVQLHCAALGVLEIVRPSNGQNGYNYQLWRIKDAQMLIDSILRPLLPVPSAIAS